MNNKPETSADITAEIRARAGVWPEPALTKYDMTLADRIDAAVKRECIEAATRAATQGVKLTNEKHANMPIGNAAKMREALSDACYAMFNFLKSQNGGYEAMAKALDKAKAALAALTVGGVVEAERHKPGNAAAIREALEKIVELTTPCEGMTSIELQVQAEALTALSAVCRGNGWRIAP